MGWFDLYPVGWHGVFCWSYPLIRPGLKETNPTVEGFQAIDFTLLLSVALMLHPVVAESQQREVHEICLIKGWLSSCKVIASSNKLVNSLFNKLVISNMTGSYPAAN